MIRFLLVALFSLQISVVFAQESPPIKIVVGSAVSHKPFPGVNVTLESIDELLSTTTDEYGIAQFELNDTRLPVDHNRASDFAQISSIEGFEELGLPSPNNFDPRILIVTVKSEKTVPLKKHLHLDIQNIYLGDRSLQLKATPKHTGFISPLIKADKGARFDIYGLGYITIKPNALSQDAKIRIVPIPPSSTSPGLVGRDNGILKMQFWVEALDENNNSLTNVIPISGNEIVLSANFLTKQVFMPDYTYEWKSFSFNDDFFETGEEAASYTKGTVALPLRAGANLVTRKGTTGVMIPSCGAWSEMTTKFIKSPPTFIDQLPEAVFNCGYYGSGASITITAGETRSSTHSLNTTTAQSAGVTVEILAVELEAETSISVSIGSSTSTMTSVLVAAEVSIPAGAAVTGNEDQASPFNCLSGKFLSSLKYQSYFVFRERHRACPEGHPGPRSELFYIGKVTICLGLVSRFNNVNYDPYCSGCSAALPIPPPFDSWDLFMNRNR